MFTTDKIKVKPDGEISSPEEVKFTLKCDCCGNERVRVIDTHVYDTAGDPDCTMITVKYLCTNCGNKFEWRI
jgi:hypothetical protein